MTPEHGEVDPKGGPRPMEGFDAATYGDRFADVYDDWYADVTDTSACVTSLATLAVSLAGSASIGRPRILELGVGTGRIAIPLSNAGLAVTGVDSSAAMLTALAAKPGGGDVNAVLGDMVRPPIGDDRFHLVLAAYNTLFNLVDPGAQERCLREACRHLEPGGMVVVEANVPDPQALSGDAVTTREVSADRVVLSVSRTDTDQNLALGQFIDITETGIRLRPWQIRWASPNELDAIAAAAGLELAARWANWDRSEFTSDSTSHISLYRAVSAGDG